jgi:hypothetical protein
VTATAYYGGGGGIYRSINHYELTIVGSTVAGNSARKGGGIALKNAFGAPTTLRGSIVADNSAATDGPDLLGPFDSAFSLIENPAGATVTEIVPGSDITGQDPQLGPLTLNGGSTQTRKPAISSPVVDKASAFGLTGDQRDQARPFDIPGIPNSAAPGADGSDIGAVELQASDVAATPVTPVAPAPITHKKKKCKKKKRR